MNDVNIGTLDGKIVLYGDRWKHTFSSEETEKLILALLNKEKVSI